MAKLSPLHVDVLRRRYGPQDYEPYLKLREAVPVPAKTDPKRAAALEIIHWNDRRKKLAGRTGPLGQVLQLTRVARDAYAAWCEEQAASAVRGGRGAMRREAGEAEHRSWSELMGEALTSWRSLSAVCAKLRGRAAREQEQLGAVSAETLVAIARAVEDRDAARAVYEETEARGEEVARRREALVASDPTTRRYQPVTLVMFIADVLTNASNERVLGAAKVEAYNDWVRPAWAAYEPLGVRRRPRMDMLDEPEDLR